MLNSKLEAAVRNIIIGCATKEVTDSIQKEVSKTEWSMHCTKRIADALYESCSLIDSGMLGLLRSVKHEHSDVRKLLTTVFEDETNNSDFKRKFVKNLLLADIKEELDQIENHNVKTIWSSETDWPRIEAAKKLFYDSKQQHLEETINVILKAINILLFSNN